MSARVRAASARDSYFDLVKRLPLLPIRTARELARGLAMIEELMRRPRLDRDEEGYLDVLSDLVESYEAQHQPIPDPTDADLLRSLLDARGVTQAEVARETGIAPSALCEMLAGKRKIARAHMGALARFFGVSAAVFVADDALPRRRPGGPGRAGVQRAS
ncbi:MAG: helix-turn-helix domain-containing protein [Chloroflexi bacterium]|nr:helix-turn-helix domain-containing protein [Chloroflexota bacterium]